MDSCLIYLIGDRGEESISNIWIGRWGITYNIILQLYFFIILSHVFNCHSKLSSYLTYAVKREENDGEQNGGGVWESVRSGG